MAKKKQSAAEKQLSKAKSKIKELGNFKYSDSAGLESSYKSSYSDYNKWVNNPEKYGFNAHITEVNDLFDQVMNQEQFSYDPQKDQLFQMYKQQYQQQGSRAMQNQMGVAAAYSGGYNSSAAQTSAQSQYQGYMDALSEKAAETYQNALDMYKYNQQNLLNKYNTARDMNNSGNEAYYKQADIKAQKMNNAYNAYNDDRNYQYNNYSSDRSYYQTQSKNALDQINWLKEYQLKKKLYKGG